MNDKPRLENVAPELVASALASAAVINTSASVVITDGNADDPRITFVNHAFEALTGYSRAEIMGRNPKFLQGPDTDPEVLARLRAALRDGETFEGMTYNYHKDGSRFLMEWSIDPIRLEDGTITHYIGIQRDAGGPRTRTEMLESALEANRRIGPVLDEHVNWLDFDVRSDINAILGYTELLKQRPFVLGSTQYLDYLDRIHMSGTKLLRYLEDSIAIMKYKFGGGEVSREFINCADLLVMIGSMFEKSEKDRIILPDQLTSPGPFPIAVEPGMLTRAVCSFARFLAVYKASEDLIRLSLGENDAGGFGFHYLIARNDRIDRLVSGIQSVFKGNIPDAALASLLNSSLELRNSMEVFRLHGGNIEVSAREPEQLCISLTF